MIKVEVLISVVLYGNSRAEVETLLASIRGASCAVAMQLIDHTPGGLSFMPHMALPDKVQYKPQPENRGYGAGHNVAIKDAGVEARYHLVLNPDVSFESEILQQLCDFMDRHPKVHLVMPQVVWPNGTDQGLRKLLPAPGHLLARRFLPRLLQKSFQGYLQQYEMKHCPAHQSFMVPVLSGCFMFCRKATLQNVGGFDERFFMYLEDVDLSRRMGLYGDNMYWPQVQVVHHYQKGSYKLSKHLKWHLQSAYHYFTKHGWWRDSYRKEINARALRQCLTDNVKP